MSNNALTLLVNWGNSLTQRPQLLPTACGGGEKTAVALGPFAGGLSDPGCCPPESREPCPPGCLPSNVSAPRDLKNKLPAGA